MQLGYATESAQSIGNSLTSLILETGQGFAWPTRPGGKTPYPTFRPLLVLARQLEVHRRFECCRGVYVLPALLQTEHPIDNVGSELLSRLPLRSRCKDKR